MRAGEAAAVHNTVQPLSNVERGWVFSRAAEHGRETIDETLFAFSDGALGVCGGLEERVSETDGVFLTAGFVEHELRYHERFAGFATSTDVRVPIADGKRIRISLGEQRADIATICVEETQRIKSAGLVGPLHIESWIDAGGAVARQAVDPRMGTDAPGLSLVARGVKDDHSFVVQRGARHIVCVVAHDRSFDSVDASGSRSLQTTLEHAAELVIDSIECYWLATHDSSFLAQASAEILFETARFWLDAGHFNPRREGAFCIHCVTGRMSTAPSWTTTSTRT